MRKRKTRKKSLASERMSQLDVNADGTVTYKEFLHGFYTVGSRFTHYGG